MKSITLAIKYIQEIIVTEVKSWGNLKYVHKMILFNSAPSAFVPPGCALSVFT